MFKSLLTGLLLCLCTLYSAGQKAEGTISDDIRRISFAGSSVTWGGGFLQSGLVRDAILNIQRKQSHMVEARQVEISGNHEWLNGPDDAKFFGGEALKISGKGSSIRFSLTGDELTIVQGMERSNQNASEIELFVDGKLLDTFSNWNPAPIGRDTLELTGDSKTKVFDLGRPFTFGHMVHAGGRVLKGDHNRGGYGGGRVPDSLDFMIIRKYGDGPEGNPEVHHWISFKEAPDKGSKIRIVYDYGAEISYEKTTIGKSADGRLESPFGDGAVSYDITRPSRVSSGLDYRETDDRARKTYYFKTSGTRDIELRIKGNCPGATGQPYFIFNFATDRYFSFQNAGIGGWKLSFFNNPQDYYRSFKKIAAFHPDVLIMETTPNDDWDVGGYRLYTNYPDLTLSMLQSMRTLPIKSITYKAESDRYTFQKWVGKIAEINARSVKLLLDQEHRLDSEPQAGDYVFVGGYFSDNREYAVRRVDRYDPKRERIYFDRPLKPEEMVYGDLSTLEGMEVRVRSFDVFENQFRKFIRNIRELEPEVRIATIVNPLPIIGARELWGYRELMDDICKDLNVRNLPVEAFYTFQYSQPETHSVEIDASALKPNPRTGYMEALIPGFDRRNRQNFQVLVHGKDVYGTAAVVYNPYAYGVDKALEKQGLEMNYKTQGVRANQAINQPMKLVFLRQAPESGKIQIRFSTNYWSGDGCHVRTGDAGSAIYGSIYYDYFRSLDSHKLP